MDEEFIRNRITELRLKRNVSEYQMSLDLGQNRSYIQAISSGRALPSMGHFLKICDYFEISPMQRPERFCIGGIGLNQSMPSAIRF